MDPQRLIHMANQIGAFFEAEVDRAVALEGIAGHIKRFWDPRMRREIFAHVDATSGEGLSELVLTALQTHRKELGA